MEGGYKRGRGRGREGIKREEKQPLSDQTKRARGRRDKNGRETERGERWLQFELFWGGQGRQAVVVKNVESRAEGEERKGGKSRHCS